MLIGGEGHPKCLDAGRFVKSTVFVDVKNDMTIRGKRSWVLHLLQRLASHLANGRPGEGQRKSGGERMNAISRCLQGAEKTRSSDVPKLLTFFVWSPREEAADRETTVVLKMIAGYMESVEG